MQSFVRNVHVRGYLSIHKPKVTETLNTFEIQSELKLEHDFIFLHVKISHLKDFGNYDQRCRSTSVSYESVRRFFVKEVLSTLV